MPRAAIASAYFALGLVAFTLAASRGFESSGSLALNAAATSLGLIAWALGGATLARQPYAERLGWLPSQLAPSVVAGLVLGMLALSQLAEWLIAVTGYQEVGNLPEFRRVLGEASGRGLGAALIGVALLPGIAEEVALRGFVQRGLEPRTGAVGAVAITSLLFAALHGEPVHAAGALLLGVYLGAIVALCGSIRPAILCHVVNNAVATVGTAIPLAGAAGALALLGVFLGPWALWRTVLQARAAHRPLGRSPDSEPPPDGARPT